jgi:hypothetical protein
MEFALGFTTLYLGVRILLLWLLSVVHQVLLLLLNWVLVHVDVFWHSKIDISQIYQSFGLVIFFLRVYNGRFIIRPRILPWLIWCWLLSGLLNLIFLSSHATWSKRWCYALSLSLNLRCSNEWVHTVLWYPSLTLRYHRLLESWLYGSPSFEYLNILSILHILLLNEILLLLNGVLSGQLLFLLQKLNVLNLFLLLLVHVLFRWKLLLQRSCYGVLLRFVHYSVTWQHLVSVYEIFTLAHCHVLEWSLQVIRNIFLNYSWLCSFRLFLLGLNILVIGSIRGGNRTMRHQWWLVRIGPKSVFKVIFLIIDIWMAVRWFDVVVIVLLLCVIHFQKLVDLQI